MSSKSNKPQFVIFRSQSGIEVKLTATTLNPTNLICYCDHPQSAWRIATEIARHNNLNLVT